MDMSPRLKEALASCELARDELRAEFAALHFFITSLLSPLLSTPPPLPLPSSFSNTTSSTPYSPSSSPASYSCAEAVWEKMQLAVDRMEALSRPQCPDVYIDTTDTWGRVISMFNLWHSEMACIAIIAYAWACHLGTHRWLLILPAFLCSPKIALLWLGLVVARSVSSAVRGCIGCFRSTSLGARCCPIAVGAPTADVELGAEIQDPEVGLLQGVVNRVLGGAVNAPEVDRAANAVPVNPPRPPSFYRLLLGGFSFFRLDN